MVARRFQDLIVWQLARELRRTLRALCEKPALEREFDFTRQLLRAARSATANIAEGFACSHAEFARYLEIASRSIREIEDRLIEGLDDHLLTAEEAEPAIRLIKRATKAISSLTTYLLNTPDPETYRPARKRRYRLRG